MPLTLWIAIRYLFSNKTGRFAPLLTITAIASIAVGMLSLVVVMSVMRGFRAELADRLMGFDSHITLKQGDGANPLRKQEVEQLFSEVKLRDVSPFVQGEVLAQSNAAGELLAQGVRVRGLEPKELGSMSRVDYFFPEDSSGLGLLVEVNKNQLPGVVIGNEIALQLSVHPNFEDHIELIAPLAELLPSGDLGANSRKYRVVGLFRTGVYEYDNKYVLISLDEAQKLLGLQAEKGWFIRLIDAVDVRGAILSAFAKIPEGWQIIGWDEQNRKLFAALKLERIAMGGVLVMVLVIASCAIVGVVMLVTAAKRKDIAILNSIGMSKRDARRIFITYSACLGTVGSFIGLIIGLATCLAIDRWPIQLPDSYYLDVLPVEIDPIGSLLFALIGIAIAVAASIYPVKQAMKLDPVEMLRYE